MQKKMNVKEYKSKLRKQYKELRQKMPPEQKKRADDRIAAKVRALFEYGEADLLLCYVSNGIEVGTLSIIDRALADKKRVAAPRCVDGTRTMEFYEIKSREELVEGSFGILEPKADPERLISSFSKKDLCIVPALAADHRGYRLGYGGGYYDRFLSVFPGTKALVLYQGCLTPRLWQNQYDVAVDVIVTERFYKRTRGQAGERA